MIDKHFQKNNKVALRNFNESVDLHDVVKVLICRMMKRANKNANIYTEYSPLKENEEYPDIWIEVGKEVYVYEIQKEITQEWFSKVMERYENYNLIVIDLKKFSEKDSLEEIKKKLKDWIYSEKRRYI